MESYYGIGDSSAANYPAQISGQAPALGVQADCPVWTPSLACRSRAVSSGPWRRVRLPAGRPDARQSAVRGRVQLGGLSAGHGQRSGLGQHGATARGPACGHPATWAIDRTQRAEPAGQYSVRHDGFAFFQSVTGNQASCDAHILSFRPLAGDLAQARTTPAFSFIVSNLCDDGHDAPCVTGVRGGLEQANAFLSRWGRCCVGRSRVAGD